MHHKILEWRARGDQWLDHLSRRRPMIGLAIAASLTIAGVVFWGWIESTALPWLGRTILTVAAMPVGAVGLAGVILILSIIVAAFVDTSPTAAALRRWLENRKKQTPEPEPAALPEPPPPSLQEIVAINDVRASARLAGVPAADRILSLYQGVRARDMKPITFVWLVDKEQSRLRDTKNRLTGVIDRENEHLPSIRQALHDFLVAYGDFVVAVHDFEREGVDLLGEAHGDDYERWEQFHADLIQRLDTMKEQSLLADLGPVLEKNLHSGLALRYSTLFARGRTLLESASPDERAFLELFCSERTISPENMIESSVYNAGLGLTQGKLLTVTDTSHGFRRFCLPQPVGRGWYLHGSSPHPTRTCVDIHPNSVVVHMSPGGGTHG